MSSMSSRRLCSVIAVTFALVGSLVVSIPAQQAPGVNPSLFADMKWRNIGPLSRGPDQGGGRRAEPAVHVLHRHGATAASGRRRTPGRTWKPIFDDQPTGSIGWVAGRAIRIRTSSTSAAAKGCRGPTWRSATASTNRTDAGETWTHLGLRDAQQIPKIAIDPKNANRLFVAALGHPYGPNRGARHLPIDRRRPARSERVLFKDVNTGGKDVDIDPSNPDIVYATLWEQRQGPWENGAWSGTNGGIFKSADGGTTWKPLTQGLPDGHHQRRARRSRRAIRSGVYVDASRPTGERHRHLPLGRCRRDVGAQHRPTRVRPAASTKRCRTCTRRTPTRSSSPTSSATSRPTAAGRSCRSRARRAATTTRTSGGTRTIRTSCCWSSIRARSSR